MPFGIPGINTGGGGLSGQATSGISGSDRIAPQTSFNFGGSKNAQTIQTAIMVGAVVLVVALLARK